MWAPRNDLVFLQLSFISTWSCQWGLVASLSLSPCDISFNSQLPVGSSSVLGHGLWCSEWLRAWSLLILMVTELFRADSDTKGPGPCPVGIYSNTPSLTDPCLMVCPSLSWVQLS